MPIIIGKRLGPSEILSDVGAGGIGEVYRATDTRLDRIVAIKIPQITIPVSPDCANDLSAKRGRFHR